MSNREPILNPQTGQPFKPGDGFGEWKGRFTPNELSSIRERNLPQPVPSLLDHIGSIEEEGRLFQVAVSEVAWRLGRDHPEFDPLMRAITRHNESVRPRSRSRSGHRVGRRGR